MYSTVVQLELAQLDERLHQLLFDGRVLLQSTQCGRGGLEGAQAALGGLSANDIVADLGAHELHLSQFVQGRRSGEDRLCLGPSAIDEHHVEGTLADVDGIQGNRVFCGIQEESSLLVRQDAPKRVIGLCVGKVFGPVEKAPSGGQAQLQHSPRLQATLLLARVLQHDHSVLRLQRRRW